MAKDATHARQIADRIINLDVIDASDVYVMATAADVLTLPPVTMENHRPYRLVIVPLRLNAGFSLTIADVMITAVYESNASSRAQIRGRINRLGSNFTHVTYVTVIGGRLQEFIADRYDRHDSFNAILKDLN